MGLVRVRHKGHKNIYVHNDLSNGAHHFVERIKERIAHDDRKGIAFDCMACLTLLAFAFEARINFLGFKRIKGWKERKPFNDKVDEVLGNLTLKPDWNSRPYSSISALKSFRDSIAHGKPVELEFDEEIIGKPEEIDRKIDLDGEWIRYCTADAVFAIYTDFDTIWKELLAASGLKVFETITHGSGGLTVLEVLAEDET